MRRQVVALLAPALATALLLPTSAHALTEVCNPYTLQEFRSGLDSLEKSMVDYDLNEARYQAETTVKNARCVNEPMPPQDLARLARLRAMMYFLDQKSDDAASWMMFYLSIDEPQWPQDMGPNHPLRLVLRDVEEPEPMVFKGNAQPPAKGYMLYNGRLMQKPTGYENVRGLVQVFDKKGEFVDGFWVDGTNYTSDQQRTYVVSGASEYVSKLWTGEAADKAPDLIIELAKALHQGDTPPDDNGTDDGSPAITDPGDSTDPIDDPTEKDPKDTTPTSVDPDTATKPDKEPKPPKVKPDKEPKPPKVKPDKEPKPPKVKPDKEPKPPKVKPDKEPKPAKPPKPPKEPKASGGISAARLSTGLGLLAVSGGLYGVAFASSNAPLPDAYTSSTLSSRRTMVNGMVIGSALAGVAGLGVAVTAFIDHDGMGVGFRARW